MARKALLVPLLASLFLSPTSGAKTSKADYELNLPKYDIPIQMFTFPSGLRIVFQEDHTRPLVSITNVIDVGASDEPPGLEGMAHLIEHLNFRAIHKGLPKNWDVVKELAGDVNAFTGLDNTTYITVAPMDAMVPLLRLESLRLQDAVEGVTEEVLNVEREVVRNELRMGVEQEFDFFGFLFEKLYPAGHPYHRNVIGKHESLNNIKLKDIQDFTLRYYRPENATLVVVGDVDLKKAGKYIQESFLASQLVDPKAPDKPIEAVTLPPRIQGPAKEPPPPADKTITYEKGLVDKTTLILGWSMPSAYHGSDFLMQMTVGMMEVAIGTYLFPTWDYQNETIDSLGCGMDGGTEATTVFCAIEVAKDQKPEPIVDKALDGLYQLWNTDNRYQEQRGQYTVGSLPLDKVYRSSRLYAMSDILSTVEYVNALYGRGLQVATTLHYTGDPVYFSRSFRELSTVNDYDAAQLAYKYLNRERHVAVVIQPFSEEERQLAEARGSENEYDGITRADQGAQLFKAGELTTERILQGIIPPDLSKRRSFTLENGLKVEVVSHGNSPLARSVLKFRGGNMDTSPWGMGDFAWRYSSWDYDFSPLEFAGSRSRSLSGSETSITVSGSAGNLRAQLNELRTAVDTLKVDGPQAGRYAKDLRKGRDDAEKKPETWADRLLWGRVYPEHTLGRYLTDSDLETIKSWGKAEAEAWLKSVVQPSNATLCVVGNVDSAAVEAEVRSMFGSWGARASGGPQPTIAPPPAPPKRQVLVFDKPGATQADMTLLCQLAPATLENQASRAVLSEFYSDLLHRELREVAGATYGAGAGQADYPGGLAYLSAFTLIQTRSVDLALKTMFTGLDNIQKGKVDAEYLQTMKWNLGRKVTTRYQTTDDVVRTLSAYSLRGYPIEAAATYRDRLAAVAPSMFPAIAEPCAGHEVVTIVGPKDLVLEEVKEAGLEAEVVDWKALIQAKDKKK